jgi:bile acid:Na+ symporter, BASS family
LEQIDAVRINFSPDQLLILNFSLAFLMFGVALNIRVTDFRDIFFRPRSPATGLLSQWILLPILTLGLALMFRPAPSIALGMILVGVCPGGNVSNFMVHLAKANAALSVMLTSISTLAAAILTPLAFSFWSGFIPGTEHLREIIYVNPKDMVVTIIQLIIIPLMIGMAVNYFLPVFTKKIDRPVRIISILIFFSFVFFAALGNWENIVNYLHIVFWIVLIHNGLALITGFWFARLNRLPRQDVRAISIETGIQNSGLGLILVFNFFEGIGGMAMIAAWWGIWHLISGFCLAAWWSRNA